ncbi:hypothetical protein PNEG_01810 [Pneumocystis murina B123]|uniref:DNA-directed RNA polymerase subunit n=1 Tax=Pneumocystis murina (strain B123) TaxID=1069680 RepID=M7NS02_PNEMU|nr:hypothetical protein PNEG_01810 [Pneumocystis murina B123]EMR10057.1 hypothetical protein PNEG_01810 [Pneumocystis murina B123]
MKEQVVDQLPKQIKHIEFGVFGPKDIIRQGVLEISTRELYNIVDRSTVHNGALDKRMGTSDKQTLCETCGEKMVTCVGHFGYVKLVLPVFHIGYFKTIITILQNICKDCSKILLELKDIHSFLKELRKAEADNLKKSQICKRINDTCKKIRICPNCQSTQGVIKKVGALKIIHEKFKYNKKNSQEEIEFRKTFETVLNSTPDMKTHLSKAHDDLNPLKVLNLFKQIPPMDCELLGINSLKGRPEMFIWQCIPAPPVCVRPSISQDGASTEDDLTVKLTEIIWTNSLIKSALEKGTPIQNLMEQWDYLQLCVAMYINSELPGIYSQTNTKPMRGFCQRLKGKQGRFRGNLSGKRVDFSARTVIGPDPNLSIDQVAIPEQIAKILTYPERVTHHNIEQLKKAIINGPNIHPGANYIINQDNRFKKFLKFGNRQKISLELKIGDIVERHIRDNDIVLFNRQPSLHKLSILCHRVKVRPWKTFRFNECVCNPYNADFDGDEMNLHVPQTEEARAEAIELMNVKNNLVTPRNGEPIIAAIQDFITASYLISQKDNFYDRKTFTHMCSFMVDACKNIDLPHPVIIKPVTLWTGKQIFNVLMRPNKSSPVMVNLDAKTRSFSSPKGVPDLCVNDGYLLIRSSEIMCGVMDKSTVGDGKKNSIFYVILKNYGPDEAAEAMNRLSKLCSRWLGNQGFSIGINDVQPGVLLREKKESLVKAAYQSCDDLIHALSSGKLENQPGCDAEQTLEAKVSGILSKVREDVGQICMSELAKTNASLIMATCGSKGSKINVSQMVSCVGQQIISGSRVPNGFQDRSLPHFQKNAKQPPAKGFVKNSFYSGLTPTEFLFHAISGREGLVDTAVKTAETGYMSRRLMKSLEDLSLQYDGTVRNSSSGIVQFIYGDDGLDPTYLEGDICPVEFTRTWNHCHNITSKIPSKKLLPYEIMKITYKYLEFPEFKDCTENFKDSLLNYIQKNVAERLSTIRKRKNLAPFLEKPSDSEYQNISTNELKTDSEKIVDNIFKVTEIQLLTYLQMCLQKYIKSKVEPGTAVGAVGAQSIGEPGTQMTLKTFHFAGVASMNVTLGVPRIKEIINAAKVISTPIITCKLVAENDIRSARVVKGRIEKTYMKDITKFIEEVYGPTSSYIGIKIDWNTINKLQLEITINEIAASILQTPKLKFSNTKITVNEDKIKVYVSCDDKNKDFDEIYYKLQHYKRILPHVIVKGIPTTSRAVINIDENGNNTLLVEGYGLRDVINTDGVVGTKTSTNHIMEMKQVLGIEAARASIIKEIDITMSSHGMNIDPRHVMLLGDVMTYKGEILGITRFGVAKMKNSVLMLASFEKTADHLFDAAARLTKDSIEGVSECIILGKTAPIGTGIFRLIRRIDIKEHHKPKPLLFDNSYFYRVNTFVK